jgi:hypothetical protein
MDLAKLLNTPTWGRPSASCVAACASRYSPAGSGERRFDGSWLERINEVATAHPNPGRVACID